MSHKQRMSLLSHNKHNICGNAVWSLKVKQQNKIKKITMQQSLQTVLYTFPPWVKERIYTNKAVVQSVHIIIIKKQSNKKNSFERIISFG